MLAPADMRVTCALFPLQAEPIPELPPDLDLASLPQLRRGQGMAEMERDYNISKPSTTTEIAPAPPLAPRQVFLSPKPTYCVILTAPTV